jgi:VCBS repeat-containing protein
VSWTYTVSVTGADDAATLGAVTPGTIAEVDQSAATTDAGLGGTLVGADVDGETLTYGIVGGTAGTGAAAGTVSKVGTYSTVTVNTATGAYSLTKNPVTIEALAAGAVVTETFTLTVNDGDGPSTTRDFVVQITGADDASTLGVVPGGSIVEIDQQASTIDTGLSGTLSGIDPEGDVLTYGIAGGLVAGDQVTKAGVYGQLRVHRVTGAYEYVKNSAAVEALDANESASETFVVTVNDGGGDPVSQTYTVTVTGADDPPSLVAVSSGSISEQDLSSAVTEAGLAGSLSASDVDGEPLTFGIQGGQQDGDTVRKTGAFGTLTVHRTTGAFGFVRDIAAVEAGSLSESVTDEFVVTVSDGDGVLVTQTYSVTRTGANDAPILETPAQITLRDTAAPDTFEPVSGLLIGRDVDAGAVLRYSIAGVVPALGVSTLVGAHGTLVVTNANGGWRFTPNAPAINALQANVTNTVQLTVDDGSATHQSPFVVRIEAVNDRPIAVAQVWTLDEDSTLAITLSATDAESPALTYTILTSPGRGALSGNAPALVYIPLANANGSDRFTFKVSDGFLESTETEVTLQIRPVNDAPTLGDVTVPGVEDTVVTLSAAVFGERYSDVDATALQSIRILSLPNAGVLRLAGQPVVVGQDIGAADLAFFVYQPAPNDETWRSFRVSASDGQISSAPATVVITLAAVNDIPTLVAVSPTSSSRPSLGGTAIPSTRIDVYADGKLIGSAQTSADGIWSMVPAAPLPDGTYSLTATSTESSNETSPPCAPVLLVVDTRAPQVPTIGVASPTLDQFPLISGTAEPGSRVQVAIDGSFLGITPVDAAGRWTLRPSSAISGGSYTLVATSQDAAGNRSGPSSPARLVIDLNAPAAPVIQSPVATATPRPEILGVAEPGATVEVVVGGILVGTAVADTSGTWRLRPDGRLPVGPQLLTARARDAVGNLGPASEPWSLTIIDPLSETPVIEGPRVTNDGTPDIFGTSAPDAQVVVWDGTVSLGTTVSDAQGRWVLAPQTPMQDGGHLLEAEVVDGFGGKSPRSDAWQLVIRRIGMPVPTVNFLSAPTGTPVIRGHFDARETVLLTVGVAGRVYRSSDGSVLLNLAEGRWSLQIPAEHRLVQGSYSVEATATDVSGNSVIDLTSGELQVGVPGNGSQSLSPVPVSPEALTFFVSDRNPLIIDLNTLFLDPQNRPLSYVLAGVDNVHAGLSNSVLRLDFDRAFNSQATIRIQVVADPLDPGAHPVYAITVIYDADKDAVPDEVEQVIGDLNRDGIDDAYENAVATFPLRSFGLGALAPTNDFVALMVGDYQPNDLGVDALGVKIDLSARINELTVRQASGLGEVPAELVDISPLIQFKVYSSTPQSNGAVVLILVLYQPNTSDVVYKFGRRSPTDAEPSFYEFNWDGRTGGQFIDTDGDGRPNLLRLVYRDGERGDDDWTANGVLVDPVFIATRDVMPPNAPLWTTKSGGVSNPRPPLAGTAEPLSMVHVYSGTEKIGVVRADESGQWALRPSRDLPDGRYLLESSAIDSASNVSPRSRTLEVWVQTQVIAVDDTMPRVPGKPMKIPVALLLTNDVTRIGPLSVKQVDSRSSRGGNLILERGWIIYTPPPGLADDVIDSFTYIAHNGSVSASAQVHMIGETWRIGPANSLIRVIPLSVGVELRFSVIPGLRYVISASNRIGSGEDWKPIGTAWSDDQGRLEVRDLDALGTTRFYRVEELP